MIESMAKNHPEVLFVTATGKDYFAEYSPKYRAAGLDTLPNVRVSEYIYDMPVQMAAADIVIARAGAMTLSELALMRKATILIPSPNVANDHQYKNAKALGDAGAAVYARESEFAGGGLQMRVEMLLCDAQKRAEMREKIAEFARADANELVLAEIEQLLSSKEGRA
jgi:UDP-N-acetylglucosamine--N-acetylmuramyl-(pentapeptide) pyrophosphoryl-undecaprenol N-acetylglucosamine transferase